VPKRLRARELLRQKPVWVPPIVVLIGLMTALYIGSAVDPIDHMEGLPVSLVQRDRPGLPTVELLGNQRAGTQGAALATNVLTPGLAVASERLGRRLSKEAPSGE
jgi:hypothetical protein